MMTKILMVTAMAAALGAAPATGQTGNALSAFAGHWRVAGVAVSDYGVQALADNDPSLMGKRLTVSPAGLAWKRTPSTKDFCANPRFTRIRTAAPAELRPQLRKLGLPRPTAFAIHCASGSWGPDTRPVLYRGADDALAMPWYDGGVLKLTRD
jgi:hypothetical protein